jgi:formate dehydrogenase accessory protein FdhE
LISSERLALTRLKTLAATKVYALAQKSARSHNLSVPINVSQQRIRRAEYLAGEHAFAAEILGFYIHVAHFQQGFQRQLEQHSSHASISVSDPLTSDFLSNFPDFLAVIEKNGPVRVARVAQELRNASFDSRSSLLKTSWSSVNITRSQPEDFLALAYLQPCAEFVRMKAELKLEGYNHPLCPFCNRLAAFGTLRQQGDAGRRSLICGFCLCEWDFRRVLCPGCGETDQASLPVYTAEQFPYIRVEACDSCHTYLKSIDLTKDGRAVPLVDELASIPLDLLAQEHEYEKLTPNLLGM